MVLLDKGPRAPAAAREAVGRWLGTCPGRDRVMLAASELVSNVVRHVAGSARIEMHLLCRSDCLRIEVHQPGGAFSPGGLRPPPVDRLDGRGLPVVAGVSERWGVAGREGGTIVWAEFEGWRGCPNDTWV